MSLSLLMFLTGLLVLGQDKLFSSSSMIFRHCIYLSDKKYIGHYVSKSGHVDLIPFRSSKEESRKVCNVKCMDVDECLATSMDDSLTCSFYNTSDFIVKEDGKTIYSMWKPCDMNKGDQPPDGRCNGIWITYLQKRVKVDSYISLDVIRMENDLSRSHCRERCLRNRLCGFINLNVSHCSLIPKWPAEDIIFNKTFDLDAKVDMWTCVNRFVETFNITTEVKKPIDEKCTGYWLLTDRQSSLSCPKVIGILFHTQVYSECLAECEQHPTCLRVSFNFTYSVCVLDCIQSSDHALHPSDMTFMEFKWVCTRSDSRKPPMNAEEQRLERLGMKCSKIIRNTDLFIANETCGTCPPGNEFTKCNEEFDYDSEWKIKDSCRVNQSYWAFPSERTQLNITGYGIMNVTRVFTGLTQYCLAYPAADNLISADYLECRIFNAPRAKYKLNPKEILSQEGWQPQPPICKIYPFPRRPRKVVIVASQQPLHSCRTKAAGIDIMRWIQVLVFRGDGINLKVCNVPHNFYVDQNGNIYEGRGWKLQSASVGTFNEETLSIAFIGWFKYELPTERFLDSVKKLIKFGVDNYYIEEEYRLYIQQDLGMSRVHRNLVFVIRNWYRYKGFTTKDCSYVPPILNRVVISFAGVFSVIMFSVFYKLCFFVVSCKKCIFLSKTCLTFHKVFPLYSSSTDQNDMLTFANHFSTVHIVYERSPEPSKKAHYSQIVGVLKAACCNILLNTSSSSYNGYDLKTYLSNLFVENVDCEVYVDACRTTYCTESSDEILITCLSRPLSALFLKNLIKNHSCICMYYAVERINANEMMNDLDEGA